MYSQRDEEEHILKFFGDDVGRFLDIGAWDGKVFSNTYRLAELGWGGVCVEPSAKPFISLMENFAGNPRVQLVNAAVMPEAGVSRWYYSADALSTFRRGMAKIWQDNVGARFEQVWAGHVTMDHLLEALPGPYHFVSIDAEGVSVRLLPFLDPGPLGTRLICIEHDNRRDDVLLWGKKYGFREVHRTDENLLIGRGKQ